MLFKNIHASSRIPSSMTNLIAESKSFAFRRFGHYCPPSESMVSTINELVYICSFNVRFCYNIMISRRPVTRQIPRKKQLYNGRYRVTASETNIFARQKLETATEKRRFLCCPCRDVINRTVSESQLDPGKKRHSPITMKTYATCAIRTLDKGEAHS
jgi:hypothetical protein